jgi:hypothetical protein
MEIGIEQFRTRRDLWLDRMLIQPLRGRPAAARSIRASRRRSPQNDREGPSARHP